MTFARATVAAFWSQTVLPTSDSIARLDWTLVPALKLG